MPTMVSAVLGLASLAVGCLLMLVLPATRVFAWAILAIGGALVAAAVAMDFARVKRAMLSDRGKSGLGTGVRATLFVAIILMANAVAVGVHRRLDFTGLAEFTLSSQTKNVLSHLSTNVDVISFFGPRIPATISGYADNLLAEYRSHTDRLSVRNIDPDLQPDLARQFGVDQLGATYGAVVFRGPQGLRQVLGPQIADEAEHAFTSAILEVTGTKQKKVYFVTGHGEQDARTDYAAALGGLRDNLFQVDQLDLVATPAVPRDAAALIIAGPRRSPAAAEVRLLGDYLAAGGRLLVLLDPNPPRELRLLLSAWGVDVGDGMLTDPASYVAPNRDNIMVPRTRNTLGLGDTYFPGATALIARKDVSGKLTLSAVVWTSAEARIENGPPASGPFAIGAFVSAEGDNNRGPRLAVIGDSDFASDPHFHNGDNGALFVRAVDWLAAGQEIVSVDRKVLVARRLILAPEQARFLTLSSVGLLPLLLLAAGGAAWWRRR